MPDPIRKTLILDFDGVLHAYTSPWTSALEVRDGPVPGAFEFLTQAVDRYDVHIFSSRSATVDGREAMRVWFLAHGLPGWVLNQVKFPAQKPPAHLTLDDRALTFEGRFPSFEEIDTFVPWNKRTQEPGHHRIAALAILSRAGHAPSAAFTELVRRVLERVREEKPLGEETVIEASARSASMERKESEAVAGPSQEAAMSSSDLGAEPPSAPRVSPEEAQALLDGRESKGRWAPSRLVPSGRCDVRTAEGRAVTGWGCVTHPEGDAKLLAAAPALAEEVIALGAANARLMEERRRVPVEKREAVAAQLGRVMFSAADDPLVDLQREVARLKKNLDTLRTAHDTEVGVSEGRRVQLFRVGEERAAEWKRAETAEAALAATRERLAQHASMVEVLRDDRATLLTERADRDERLRRAAEELAAREESLVRTAAENERLHKELQALRAQVARSTHDE